MPAKTARFCKRDFSETDKERYCNIDRFKIWYALSLIAAKLCNHSVDDQLREFALWINSGEINTLGKISIRWYGPSMFCYPLSTRDDSSPYSGSIQMRFIGCEIHEGFNHSSGRRFTRTALWPKCQMPIMISLRTIQLNGSLHSHADSPGGDGWLVMFLNAICGCGCGCGCGSGFSIVWVAGCLRTD
jgi:hypothetical protein